ncbi:MAG TPA: 50S ribosomal protein L21 [Actinomycetota bacterium]|nr:50S ribosomal protein L21 [Actinomycetota bacterium]
MIRVGGKQERVKAGDVIEVEFMHVDPGSAVEFQPVVVMDDEGRAHHGKDLQRAKVVAKLLGDKKGDKVKVFKYRPKSGYRRTQGHRQMLTLLEIEEVALDAERVARKPEPAAEAAEEAAAKKPAAKKPTAKKPTAKKPAAKKPAAKKPAAKKPAAKPAGERAAKRSAAAGKATSEPSSGGAGEAAAPEEPAADDGA